MWQDWQLAITAGKAAPSHEHQLTAFRLIGQKSPGEKQDSLRRAIKTSCESIVFKSKQLHILKVPGFCFVYWVRQKFFDLFGFSEKFKKIIDVCEPSTTGNNYRFIRFCWEVDQPLRWVPISKGGGYSKWSGFDFYELEWQYSGTRVKNNSAAFIRNEQYMFRPGLTFTQMARGSLGVRYLPENGTFGKAGPGIFTKEFELPIVSTILNCRVSSYLLRCINTQLTFSTGSILDVPLPKRLSDLPTDLENYCILIKRLLLSGDPLERNFFLLHQDTQLFAILLHTIEGIIEKNVFEAYELDLQDTISVVQDTGSPAGLFPMIRGYETMPALPAWFPEVPKKVLKFLEEHSRQLLDQQEIDNVKKRLRLLYEVGSSAREDDEELDTDGEKNDEADQQIAIGANIPVPPESFLEGLSQKIGIHPISVYWLLKEGIEKDGWRCLPEERRINAGRFTVVILRLLGHRWPLLPFEEIARYAVDNLVLKMA